MPSNAKVIPTTTPDIQDLPGSVGTSRVYVRNTLTFDGSPRYLWKVNRGAGYGLEIPCVYQFYGPKPYIDKLREVIDSLKTSGLV